MTFIQKLIWFIVIFFVAYILLIFNSPIISGAIEKALGIEGFNNFVLKFKGAYDTTVTNIPTKDELKNAYETVASGAVEFGDNFKMGADFTKEKIDGYRLVLSGAEGTYYEIIDGYNEAKDYVNTNSGIINEIRNTIETFSGISKGLTNTGTLDGITNTIDKVSEIKDSLVGTGEIN